MITDGPFALTADVPLTLQDPAATLGNFSSSVQVQNISPFILAVTANGQSYTLADFTAQTIPLTGDGTPIVILPSSGPVGSQGNVEAVWLLANEQAPMTDGQLTGAATYAEGLGSLVYPPTVMAASGGVISINGIALGPTARTLILSLQDFSGVVPVTNIIIQGNTTGFVYYNAPPYLAGSGNTAYLVVVPMAGIIDSEVNVGISTASGHGGLVALYSDTALYDESVFYNGTAQTASGNGALVSGPCRILTASVLNTAGAGGLAIGAANVLTTNTANTVATVAFPPNTLIPLGSDVETQGGSDTVGDVTYAYP